MTRGNRVAPNLSSRLLRAGLELGVEVSAPYTITLNSGEKVTAVALVKRAGSVGGMLIVTEYDQVRNVYQELQELGFGFSVLEEASAAQPFALGEFAEMFRDWEVC